MPIAPGSRHGVFQIGEMLGKGGMGEVYRARDTKLDRDVAVKVLPEAVVRDSDLIARFSREARMLAGLNHPNIAHLYGLEESGGVLAIIMEYVPGPTLAERIRQGPVPIDEALAIARQITAALEAAHDTGVIHRDLKPANIKVTPDGVVKLLDFGLAKSKTERQPAPALPDSPTLTLRETEAGVILGTAGYMAPEQVRGTHVDKRADIWAFGVVLFELLSGARVFTGGTVSDILANTLNARIEWPLLPPDTPGGVRVLLERCLERDRKKRLRDIGDAWLLTADSAVPPPVWNAGRRWPWVVLSAFLAAALAVAIWLGRSPVDKPLRRLNISLGAGTDISILASGPAAIITADGTRIAYVSSGKGKTRQIFTRRLDQAEARALAGTEEALNPFFSPDGLWIGFFAGRKLKKISVDGGMPVALANTGMEGFSSGSWTGGDRIIASLGEALVEVSALGGPPRPVTSLAKDEIHHNWPQVLPGGKVVVFTSNSTGFSNLGAVEAVVLATGQRKVLQREAHFGRYIAAGKTDGYLTWVNQGTLFAAPIDPEKLELTGPSRPVLENIAVSDRTGGAQIDFSADGTVLYAEPPVARLSTVVWSDAAGATQPLIAKPGNYGYPLLSPDGKRLAVLQQVGGNRDLWIHELDRDVPRRLTFTPESEYVFVWTRDGQSIIYSVGKQLRAIRADGSTPPVTLYESKSLVFLHAISADGRYLAFCEQGLTTANDLLTAPLEGTVDQLKIGTPTPFQASPFVEIYAAFSPDGKWLAYGSDESGTPEIFVRPFPSGIGKYQISSGGGKRPLWSPNGREFFFHSDDDHMMVVDYKSAGGALTFSRPRQWSNRRLPALGTLRNFTITPDGKRFAVIALEEGSGPMLNNEVVMLDHFAAELKRKLSK